MQSIYNIAEICSQLGVQHAVMSPGSRCAPLTISFAQHPNITELSIPDERSAGFIALGIAQATNTPVVLICTSGSAVLNYAPAIAEAFYQQIPLIVLSADRPAEWIDQLDGQTIHQHNAFGKHVKECFQLPVDNENKDSVWFITRAVSEAINLSQEGAKGPVHINVPLREPFYPNEAISFDTNTKAIQPLFGKPRLSKENITKLNRQLQSFKQILFIVGQGNYTENLSNNLEQLNIPVITEVISNLPANKNQITTIDLILNEEQIETPDLIISIGLSILSKPLKQWLRKSTAQHWHIQDYQGSAPDTYQKLTRVIQSELSILNELETQKNNKWLGIWNSKESVFKEKLRIYFDNAGFSEFKAIQQITDCIPDNSKVHYANSMTVRYANYYPVRQAMVYANRGTSGIDGSSSTAVGVSLNDNVTNTLLTGDLSFFYDSNAYWNNYIKGNLRIIVLNNHGGGIFRMIDGPAKQKELEPYFVVNQPLEAQKIAELYGYEYHKCHDQKTLKAALNTFYNVSNSPKILEVLTDGITNTELFKQFKKDMK